MFKSVRMRASKLREKADCYRFEIHPSLNGFTVSEDSRTESLRLEGFKGELPPSSVEDFAIEDFASSDQQAQPLRCSRLANSEILDSNGETVDACELSGQRNVNKLTGNLPIPDHEVDGIMCERLPEVHIPHGRMWAKSHQRSNSMSPNVEATQTVLQQAQKDANHVMDMAVEVAALKAKLDGMRTEVEELRTFKQKCDTRENGQDRVRLKIADAQNEIKELKEELAYEKSISMSLELQLQKTGESNSQLLMEIHDLEAALHKKDTQIEQLAAVWSPLHGYCNESDKTVIHLQKALNELEKDSKELTEENLNLLIQLNEASQKIKEQNAIISQLEGKVASHTPELPTKTSTVDGCIYTFDTIEAKLKTLLKNIATTLSRDVTETFDDNTLLDKIEHYCVSLCSQYNQLQSQCRYLEEQRRQVGDQEENGHEKEKMVLQSQKGQLKGLKERITAISADYEALLRRASHMEIEREELTTRLKTTTADYEVAIKRAKDMESEREELRKQLTDLTHDHEIALSKSKDMELEMKNIHERLMNMSANYERVLKKNEEMEVVYANMVNDHEIKVTKLIGDINAATSQIKAMGESLALTEAINKRVKDVEKENELHLSHIEELETQLSVVTEENEFLSRTVSSLESANRELQTENAQMQHSIVESEHKAGEHASSMKAEIEALNSQVNMLQDKLRKGGSIVEERDILVKQIQNFQNEKAELEAALRMVIEQQKEDLKQFTIQMVQVENENIEIKKLVSQLQACIHDMEKEVALGNSNKNNQNSENASCDNSYLEKEAKESSEENSLVIKDFNKLEGVKKSAYISDSANLQMELENSQSIIREMKLEKAQLEASFHNISLDNARLVEELSNLKGVTKKHSNGVMKHSKVAFEGRQIPLKEKLNKASKTAGLEVEQRDEIVKLRKQVVELKHKLLQQEDNGKMRKKTTSFEDECEPKAGTTLAFTESKLKKKQREEKQTSKGTVKSSTNAKSLKRETSKARPLSNLNPSNDAKELSELRDKLKLLEGELKTKSVELEAAKYILREKESESYKQLECVESGKENCTAEVTNSRLDFEENQFPVAQLPNVEEHGNEGILAKRLEALELELGEALEANNTYKLQLQSCALAKHVQMVTMEEELLELRERYTSMSLRFAEVEAEKERLIFAFHKTSHVHQPIKSSNPT